MRYRIIAVLTAFLFMCTSCGGAVSCKGLDYQNMELYIEAVFALNGDEVPLTLSLKAPEYGEDGRMLARDAVLTFGEDSIISGVGFEFYGGDVYVSAGDLRIPVDNEDTVKGISDIISLFCISEEHYYSSEKIKRGELDCERLVYIDGDNRVEVEIDLSCMLPTSINASVFGKELSADIKMIKAVP